MALEWKELKRWSFGALKLKPDEFWNLTLVELSDMLQAFVEEERRQDDVQNQRFAWQTAHLMNASGNYKKTIKTDHLYKPLDTQEEQKPKQNIVKKFDSKEQKEEYLRDLIKRVKGDRADGS